MTSIDRSRPTFIVAVALATYLHPPTPSPQAQVPPASPIETQLLALHNATRATAHLPLLAIDPRLTAAAQVQAADCAQRRAISHVGSDGSTVGVRLARQGYGWAACAENAGLQYALPLNWPGADPRRPAWAMQAWMGSPGHRANILNRAYQDFGAAMVVGSDGAKYYIVTFGRRS